MKNVFTFLKDSKITNSIEVDRLLISTYIMLNEIKIEKNTLLKSYIIKKSKKNEYTNLMSLISIINIEIKDFNFEILIQLFEFVISPTDKIVNGAVYTPVNIRKYITDITLLDFKGDLKTVKIADISCGCGGFLLSAAQELKRLTGRKYKDIYRDNIFGNDIAQYSVERSKILLTLLAVTTEEDHKNFQFNLFVGNSLIFDWKENCSQIKKNLGFDLIIGNPPYVCSRNMDKETLLEMKNWEVANTGHPDLYIPFFQIGLENLNPTGILGYITVNTFIKSINGRALREYFDKTDVNLTILNFGGEQVFKNRNTYTCICFLKKNNSQVNYIRTTTAKINDIDLNDLYTYQYENLHHIDGWNLVNDTETKEFINTVESTGVSFKNLYNTKNGIATLKNNIYKFVPVRTDKDYYYLKDENNIYPIEKKICRDIVNANKIKSIEDINLIKEKIIFPYDKKTQIIPEGTMIKKYPMAYQYLSKKKTILATRDKSTRTYEAWYAYGRRQSMDIHAYKLFFPHICERPTFIISEEMDLLFYNGLAIVSDNIENLQIIKKMMESEVFFKYIKNVTKDYSSGYISMSRNHLKNFGVYQFNDQQKIEFLAAENVNEFLEDYYRLNH